MPVAKKPSGQTVSLAADVYEYAKQRAADEDRTIAAQVSRDLRALYLSNQPDEEEVKQADPF